MAAGWSSPDWVVPNNPTASFSGPVMRPRLIVDEAHGSLHVIYSLYGTNGNLYYLRSPGHGAALGRTARPDRCPRSNVLHRSQCQRRIILDKAGSLHVVWDYLTKEGEEWYTRAIEHRTSTDNGETWSTPIDVAFRARRDLVGQSRCRGERRTSCTSCLCAGTDPEDATPTRRTGAKTWARPQRLFGGYDSLAGWDSMTVESNEEVHLIAQLRDLEYERFIWHAVLGRAGMARRTVPNPV